MFQNISLKSVLTSGIAATAAMTAFTFMAPLMGFEMNIPAMLANTMGTPVIVGWSAHLMIGIILAVNYAVIYLPVSKVNNKIINGALFGVLPWMFAQIMVMPMMTLMNGGSFVSGLFSGSLIIAAASLMGHLLYGAVLGFLYRPNSVTQFKTAKA